MIDHREARAYERAEIRFRKACLDDASRYSHLVWRFMSKRDLKGVVGGILQGIRDEGDYAHSAIPSTVSVIREFLNRDLLREVGETAAERFRVYWLILRGGRADGHNPFELVSALDRAGVVSHSSALAFHGLTDIRAKNHFLTAPRKRPARRLSGSEDVAQRPREEEQPPRGAARGPKIGTRCFSHEGLTFRLRHSYPEHIFGDAEHWTDDYERVRIFGLERALLDAVNDPACNGGMRGVVEAWETGAERFREDRLLAHLHEFERESLWRRVGALADHVGRAEISGKVASEMPAQNWVGDPLPLVWNLTKGSIVMPWNVIVPW